MSTIIIALFIMVLLALIIGLTLGYLAIRLQVKDNPIVEKINALLPQTQCGQCGFPGCKPYAASIASGETPINRCAPGGQQTIQALADLLGCEPIPLNEAFGVEKPKSYAVIQEDNCIGCTLCIQACPVDAIVGAAKQLHIVVDDLCTGCMLCIDPCPVDCIDMVPVTTHTKNWRHPYPVFQMKKING